MRSRIASLLALILVAGSGCAVRADAQPPYSRGPVYGSDSWQHIAYEDGYRAGLITGERDARSGRAFEYRNDRAYRDADRGYRGGNRGPYRQIYRRGFEVGYRDGYNRFSRYTYRGPSGRYPDRGYAYGSVAWDRGFADGYEKGREDARDNDRFDPRRHKWYREGDRGYNRRYGARERYEAEYRNAFMQGYQQGYREHGRGYGYRR